MDAFLFFVYIAQKRFLFFYTCNNFLTDTIFFDRCKQMFVFCEAQKREKKQKNRKNRVFSLYFLQICIFCKHFGSFARRRSFPPFSLQREKEKKRKRRMNKLTPRTALFENFRPYFATDAMIPPKSTCPSA